MDGVTVAEWLRQAAERLREAGIESPSLEARVLAAHVLGGSAADVVLLERALTAVERDALEALLARRLQREPLQYVLGWAEFWSLRLEVSPDVLIPRPETEHLVEVVLDHLRAARDQDPMVADLGTGSGAVAVALAHELPHLRVFAVDISPRALDVARRNAARHGVDDRVTFLQGSWCEPLLEAGLAGRLDAVVSNPPYVTRDEAHLLSPEVLRYEPPVALFAEGDPLANYRAVAAGASQLLRAGGLLAVEVPPHRADDVRRLLEGAPVWTKPWVRSDYAGRPRVVGARRLAAAPREEAAAR